MLGCGDYGLELSLLVIKLITRRRKIFIDLLLLEVISFRTRVSLGYSRRASECINDAMSYGKPQKQRLHKMVYELSIDINWYKFSTQK